MGCKGQPNSNQVDRTEAVDGGPLTPLKRNKDGAPAGPARPCRARRSRPPPRAGQSRRSGFKDDDASRLAPTAPSACYSASVTSRHSWHGYSGHLYPANCTLRLHFTAKDLGKLGYSFLSVSQVLPPSPGTSGKLARTGWAWLI